MAIQTLGEYDQLLAQAVRLRKQHETRAKDYVPKMYKVLVQDEGLTPQDAADRIYKDLIGIWEKDTIRRLLPDEAKNQSAKERQKLSRSQKVSKAGLILQGRYEQENAKIVMQLERKNAHLVEKVEALQKEKNELLEKTLRLERMLVVQRELHGSPSSNERKVMQSSGNNNSKTSTITTVVVLPPNLFMKAFTLMRSSTKPLVLKVSADQVVDVEKIGSI